MARKRQFMLAKPLEDRLLADFGDVFYVQPKLNGVRCTVIWEYNEPILLSSTGRRIQFLSHITDELKFHPKYDWDGELYIHGKSWEYINSICSRTVNPHPDSMFMEYHVFDTTDKYDAQSARLYNVDTLKNGFTTTIRVVETHLADKYNYVHLLDKFVSANYEGIMFRAIDALYQNKRTNSLLKFKPTCTDIYKIIGVEQGTGWCSEILGAFVVEAKDGSTFSVGTGSALTADNRTRYWKDRNDIIGKYLLVKHEKLKTISGIPKSTVGVTVLTDNETAQFRSANHNDLI